jgi:LemA protein
LPWIIVASCNFVIYSWVKGINNTAVTLSQDVRTVLGDVQTAYQRRNDLIGNLVNTVKAQLNLKKNTLTAVIEARSKATAVKLIQQT